jgi:hypothetical protein
MSLISHVEKLGGRNTRPRTRPSIVFPQLPLRVDLICPSAHGFLGIEFDREILNAWIAFPEYLTCI